jgi:hypothetical protein
MLRSLVNTASRLYQDFHRVWQGRRFSLQIRETVRETAARATHYDRLERVFLTDEVNRTILEEFAAHRQDARGEEETGWVLLGVREERQATVLATLPAGAGRDAGVAHVRFNSNGQALASRIVRQWDKRLTILGVVHTHPGRMRHPSEGDYRGDIEWVSRLRGREGIFAIGTADAASHHQGNGTATAYQPHRHTQVMGELCLSWYCLGEGDRNYRPLEMGVTIGPDLARPLRPVWPAIEEHAEELDRLCRQQANLTFAMLGEAAEAALCVQMPLAGEKESLRVLLNDQGIRYYWIRGSELTEVNPREQRIDRGVYMILAELAR